MSSPNNSLAFLYNNIIIDHHPQENKLYFQWTPGYFLQHLRQYIPVRFFFHSFVEFIPCDNQYKRCHLSFPKACPGTRVHGWYLRSFTPASILFHMVSRASFGSLRPTGAVFTEGCFLLTVASSSCKQGRNLQERHFQYKALSFAESQFICCIRRIRNACRILAVPAFVLLQRDTGLSNYGKPVSCPVV